MPCSGPFAPSAPVICMMVPAARTATSGAALGHAQPHRAPRASRRLAGRRRRARAPALQPDASHTTAGTARRPRRFLLVQSASTPPPRRFVTAPLEEGASRRRRFARCYRGEPPPPRAAAASTATGTIFRPASCASSSARAHDSWRHPHKANGVVARPSNSQTHASHTIPHAFPSAKVGHQFPVLGLQSAPQGGCAAADGTARVKRLSPGADSSPTRDRRLPSPHRRRRRRGGRLGHDALAERPSTGRPHPAFRGARQGQRAALAVVRTGLPRRPK